MDTDTDTKKNTNYYSVEQKLIRTKIQIIIPATQANSDMSNTIGIQPTDVLTTTSAIEGTFLTVK